MASVSRRRPIATPRLSWRQDQALSSTLRIVQELGPTAFVLKEEAEEEEQEKFRLLNCIFKALRPYSAQDHNMEGVP
ncbi:UNVERIFIED_CONTAM: hypothetical protein K2H54_046513 [Gekko kuhli]